MASSSGNSSVSGSTQIQNSGSEEDLQQQVMVVDQRKRKRMQSNRESARRSRMRKQKHLDDLMTQVGELRKDNSQILSSINITNQHFLNVDSENSILRVQVMELSQRLQSLNDILSYINTNTINSNNNNNSTTNNNNIIIDGCGFFDDLQEDTNHDGFMNEPWNLLCVNQPIMASAEMFQY